MFSDLWEEIWNADNPYWKVIDRILFFLLPIITIVLQIYQSSMEQGWHDLMINILSLAALVLWIIFFFLVVPWRVALKYKHKWIASLVWKPPANRNDLIKAMQDCKYFLFDNFKPISFKRKLIDKANKGKITKSDVEEIVISLSTNLIEAFKNLDTQIRIAGSSYTHIFDEFKSKLFFPVFIDFLASQMSNDESDETEKLRKSVKSLLDMENLEDGLDEEIDKAIDLMDKGFKKGAISELQILSR